MIHLPERFQYPHKGGFPSVRNCSISFFWDSSRSSFTGSFGSFFCYGFRKFHSLFFLELLQNYFKVSPNNSFRDSSRLAHTTLLEYRLEGFLTLEGLSEISFRLLEYPVRLTQVFLSRFVLKFLRGFLQTFILGFNLEIPPRVAFEIYPDVPPEISFGVFSEIPTGILHRSFSNIPREVPSMTPPEILAEIPSKLFS